MIKDEHIIGMIKREKSRDTLTKWLKAYSDIEEKTDDFATAIKAWIVTDVIMDRLEELDLVFNKYSLEKAQEIYRKISESRFQHDIIEFRRKGLCAAFLIRDDYRHEVFQKPVYATEEELMDVYAPKNIEASSLFKTREEARDSNVKYYFSGKKCKKGHVSVRATRNGECYQCAAATSKETKRRYNAKKKLLEELGKTVDKHHPMAYTRTKKVFREKVTRGKFMYQGREIYISNWEEFQKNSKISYRDYWIS